jgi:zinc transport system ATP-binding protein
MNPTSNPLIQLDSVSYQKGNRQILQHVSLTLHAGEIVSVIGPNGAGKTTLLKIMVGLITPTQGTITRTPNLRIGYMPQRLHIDSLFPLTVKRFLQLGQSNISLESTLTEVGVSHAVLHSPLYAVSGGELQRILLARALLRKPDLLVLDEPAQGVDLMGQGELYDLISHIRDHHDCAILLVSHDLNVVMAQTDNVVCLNQHICCSGHPDKVTRDPAFTALFGKVANNLAFYTHRHDHHHGVQGEVIAGEKDQDDHSHD